MKTTQEFVNVIDSENAVRWWKHLLIFLLGVCLFAFYNLQEYRNFSNSEAMDMAQLARNIAQGKGYVTDNIRISSMFMVAEQNHGDYMLNGNHPDIVNPPLYPVVLAGLMKAASPIIPLDYSPQNSVFRFFPEMLITFFNQALLFLCAILTYSLGKKMFDREVGFFAAIVLILNDMLWKFSISGLPTLLSMLILLILFRLLYSFRIRNHTENVNDLSTIPSIGWTLGKSFLIGLLVGAACLTQYALGWIIVPVLWYVMLSARKSRKTIAGLTVLIIFACVVAPWITRNFMVSGMPFGLATYAPAAETSKLTDNVLERVATADILAYYGPEQNEYLSKMIDNLSDIFQNEVPKIAGSWLSVCFLAGILLPFIAKGLNSTRFLLVICLLLSAIAEAATRTHLTKESPGINGENLLVVFAPMVFIFGAAFIFTMIEEINYELPSIRKMIIWVTGGFLCLPLFVTLLPPAAQLMAWPPYHPQSIHRISNFYKAEEMFASDMPWAVAWYGHHSCMGLPLNPEKDFFKINDDIYPIQGLYLTQLTLDQRFLTDFTKTSHSWGDFLLQFYGKGMLPGSFPLRNALRDLLPDQVFLSDWERWRFSSDRE